MVVDAVRQILETLTLWVADTVGISAEVQRIVFVLLLVVLIPWLARRTAMFVINRQVEDTHTIYHWRKGTDYAAVILGIFLAWRLLFTSTNSTASWSTYLGLVTAGLAIALQAPITNFIAWAFIVARRPFQSGDRIQIGEHTGDVVDIRFFQFSMLEIGGWVDAEQSTGRVLHIPNRMVFSHAIASYSKGFPYIWSEIPVLLTFESDWEQAKQVLQTIAEAHSVTPSKKLVREHAKRYGISYGNLTPTVYTNVEASGVELTIRFLCEPRQRRIANQAIWEDTLRAFAANEQFDLAYPTQRLVVTNNRP